MTSSRSHSGGLEPELGTAPLAGGPARAAAIQGKAIEIITQALMVTWLPRLLGPVEFGRLMVAVTVTTLASVAISLGAPAAFARFVPAETPDRRKGLARAMTRHLLGIRALQLGVAAALAVALVLVLPARFHALDTGLVVSALAIDVAAVLGAQIALGLGLTWVWSFRIAVKNAALLIAIPVLYVLMGPAALLAGIVVSAAAGFGFAAWKSAPLVRGLQPEVAIPRGAFRYGIVAGLAALVGQVMYRGPVLAAGAVVGSSDQTGFVALASSIALAVMLAVRELFTVSLPEMVEQWGEERGRAERLTRRIGWWSIAALTTSAIAGVGLVRPLLPVIVGEQFVEGLDVLVPVLVLLPLLPLPLLCWQVAALQLRPHVALVINGAGAVAFVATAALLIPLLGGAGATAGLLTGVFVSSLLSAWKLPQAVSPALLGAGILGSAAITALAMLTGLVA
jgi:O-antigen/teichoic acid export membrane protein